MPEQLSQSQIDALLKKMSSGEDVVQESSQKVREYDFKSPKKFTKEQLKSLDSLHKTFSKMLASYLSGTLRTVCEVDVLQIEEQRYYEYNNALPDNSLTGLVGIKPADKRYDDSTMILDLSTSLGFYIIGRVLGGPETECNFDRSYTDIEIAILSNIFQKITQRIEATWNHNLDISASLSGIKTNSRLLQVFAPEDIVVIVVMTITLGNKIDGTLSVCLSAEFLEEIIDTFSPRFAPSNKRQDPQREEAKKRMVLENVCESDMEVQVTFDRLKLELRDIMQLQKDDIIPLGKPIDSDVLVSIGKVPWFTAKLGETKQKKAIKLQNILSDGEEGIQWEQNKTSC